jgi:hypothetical protein
MIPGPCQTLQIGTKSSLGSSLTNGWFTLGLEAAAGWMLDKVGTAQTPRPVIFLDIDGVLNRSGAKSDEHTIDRTLLHRFKRLVAAVEARVVLVSTWRHEQGGERLAHDLGVPFEDAVPDLRPHSRGDEVRTWLRSHPGVTRFVILDDDDDGYGDMPLFQPNPYTGLSDRVAGNVEAFLTGERQTDSRRTLFVRVGQYIESFVTGHRG